MPASRLNLICHFFQFVSTTSLDSQAHTFGGQSDRDTPTDAHTGASDQGGFVSQLQVHEVASVG